MFRLKVPLALYVYHPGQGCLKSDSKQILSEDLDVSVLRTTGDKDDQLVVGIDKDKLQPKDDKVKSKDDKRKERAYFCIDRIDFNHLLNAGSIIKIYDKWHSDMVYGLSLVLPFKLRPATAGFNTALTESLTLGGVLGARWRISRFLDYHVDFPVVTAGLSTLDIEQGRAPSTMDGGKQVLGFTASVGAVLELTDFQLGLMVGVDHAPGDQGQGWVYNDKVWYSFSIGYTFLKNPAK
ncbi:MAG TPA: hypothetical protein VF516_35915 [Kofleriaceae bacterium]